MSVRRIGPFNSYKSLFKIQHVIYKLGNIRLWGFGVSFDQLATGAVAFTFLWLLYTVFPLLNYFFINKWILMAAASLGAMWASARYELGGKTILAWTFGIIKWSLRSKYTARSAKMKKPGYRKSQIYLRAAYRDVTTRENKISSSAPCEVSYKDVDHIIIQGMHKISINPNKKKITLIPTNRQNKNAIVDEELIYLQKNKVSTVYTTDNTTHIENVQILSQPASSPKKVKKNKPKYSLAWYIETNDK